MKVVGRAGTLDLYLVQYARKGGIAGDLPVSVVDANIV
jgi:hypothetical protein